MSTFRRGHTVAFGLRQVLTELSQSHRLHISNPCSHPQRAKRSPPLGQAESRFRSPKEKNRALWAAKRGGADWRTQDPGVSNHPFLRVHSAHGLRHCVLAVDRTWNNQISLWQSPESSPLVGVTKKTNLSKSPLCADSPTNMRSCLKPPTRCSAVPFVFPLPPQKGSP